MVCFRDSGVLSDLFSYWFSILYLTAVVSSSQFLNVFIATSNLYLVFHYCSFIYQYCDFFVFPLIGANSDNNITYTYITEKRWNTENQFFSLLRIDFGQRLKCKRELFLWRPYTAAVYVLVLDGHKPLAILLIISHLFVSYW